jgi:hypothetical protein
MNRRAFLKFLITAPITAALPWSKIAMFLPAPVADEIHLTLDEIISATLRAYRPQIIANLAAHNSLLKSLQSNQRFIK